MRIPKLKFHAVCGVLGQFVTRYFRMLCSRRTKSVRSHISASGNFIVSSRLFLWPGKWIIDWNELYLSTMIDWADPNATINFDSPTMSMLKKTKIVFRMLKRALRLHFAIKIWTKILIKLIIDLYQVMGKWWKQGEGTRPMSCRNSHGLCLGPALKLWIVFRWRSCWRPIHLLVVYPDGISKR